MPPRVLHEARRYVAGAYPQAAWPIPRGDGTARLLLHGNHALALGACAAGCRFMAAYPMTPATTILDYLASIGVKEGVVTKHAEQPSAWRLERASPGRAR